MYHYVRDLRRSRYPDIKALETDYFRAQIAYIKKYYNVISGEELLTVIECCEFDALPPRPLLLTFDDGYIDHYMNVFPILSREKLPGCFFPVAKCTLENRVLDVNKIHFILASVSDKNIIIEDIFRLIDNNGKLFQTKNRDDYWDRLAINGRYDSKEIIFIKHLLQRELPEELRLIIVNYLFNKYVTSDEESFARELYMNESQIISMRENGMCIGSHGYSHCWLNAVDPRVRDSEIETAVQFLKRIGVRTDRWIMCYPHGGYDESLLLVLRNHGCKIGLTTNVGIVDLQRDNYLTLPRLNTNDLPKQIDALPNEWTRQILM